MRYRYQSGDQVYEVELDRRGAAYRVVIDGQVRTVEVLDRQPGQVTLRIDGRAVTVHTAEAGGQKWLSAGGCTFRLEPPKPRGRRGAGGEGGGESVRAPMPAQVRAVQAEAGQQVQKGDTLLLLEAMKMEIRVRAPAEGRVARITVTAGQTVEKDQLLAEIEPA